MFVFAFGVLGGGLLFVCCWCGFVLFMVYWFAVLLFWFIGLLFCFVVCFNCVGFCLVFKLFVCFVLFWCFCWWVLGLVLCLF